ncbi:MAG: DNA polymerase III subunit delta [Clostridia bacterium]|nr:DNA polymerase III subunit delta [Clostridia bacterium]
MKFKDLKKSLSQTLSNIYLVEGEDAFLRENAVRLIKEKALSEPDLNLTNLYGQDVKGDPEVLLTSTESYPFMSEKRYVVLRDFYPTATDLKNKALKKVFSDPCDSTVLIIVNEQKCDNLKKLDTVTFVDCYKADEEVIVGYVRRRAMDDGVVITSGAIRLLLEYSNMDMTRIGGELEKLLSFVGANSEITEETVELLVTKSSDFQVYELTEAIGKRDYGKAFEMLSDMLGKNQDKQRLFISIYYHFRRLLHATVSKATNAELASVLETKEFVIKKAREQAKRFTPKRLKQICDRLAYYDGAFKSGELGVDTALWNSILNTMITE